MSTTPTQRITEFNKAVFDVSIDTTRSVVEAVTDGAGRAWRTARDTGATVVGQARAAVDQTAGDATTGVKKVVDEARTQGKRTAGDATTGVKQVVGQARAQGERAAGELDGIADRTARRATAAVDQRPSPGTPYEDWNKADLYDRAQELDVTGRSNMSKPELIAALRNS